MQDTFETIGGWTIEAKANKILGGLGFDENQIKEKVSTLSGGWRMRVVLASILLIVQGIQVNIFNSPEFFLRTGTFIDNYFNYLLTILWVTTLTNAFNFIDSSDGLAVGLSGLSSAFFIFISLEFGAFYRFFPSENIN